MSAARDYVQARLRIFLYTRALAEATEAFLEGQEVCLIAQRAGRLTEAACQEMAQAAQDMESLRHNREETQEEALGLQRQLTFNQYAHALEARIQSLGQKKRTGTWSESDQDWWEAAQGLKSRLRTDKLQWKQPIVGCSCS